MDNTGSEERLALVVDDEPSERQKIKRILEGENFTVDEAIDGREALDRLKQRVHYKLIVLDVLMPYVDGFEVMKLMKANDPQRLDTIIVVSRITSDDLKRFFPVSYVMNKPVDEKEFVEIVRQCCSKSAG